MLEILGFMAVSMIGIPLMLWASTSIYARMERPAAPPQDLDGLRAQLSDLERRLQAIEAKAAT